MNTFEGTTVIGIGTIEEVRQNQMPIHDEQENEGFSDWLKTEPELLKLSGQTNEPLESIYRIYFELGAGLSPEQAAAEVRHARKWGFEVSVKTSRGELRAVVDPTMALIDIYFNVLKNQLGLTLAKFSDYDLPATTASDKQKKLAIYTCALYLVNFVNKLQQELRGTMEEASQLAKIEIAKQMSFGLNLRQMIEALGKQTEKRRKREAGVTRGGERRRTGFKWDKSKKVAFYEMVNKTPRRKEKTVWEYACEFLIEEGFEGENIKWLLDKPGFENVDQNLFRQAVKSWRKYDGRNEIVDDNDKPRYFEYRQALINLQFPDKFKFSTLDNYTSPGKAVPNFQSSILEIRKFWTKFPILKTTL